MVHGKFVQGADPDEGVFNPRGYNMHMRNIAPAFWGWGLGRGHAAAGDTPLYSSGTCTSTDYCTAHSLLLCRNIGRGEK